MKMKRRGVVFAAAFAVLASAVLVVAVLFSCGGGGGSTGGGGDESEVCPITGPHWQSTEGGKATQSTDNGATWCWTNSADLPQGGGDAYDMATDGAGTWVIAGGSGTGGGVLYSSDGGATWGESSAFAAAQLEGIGYDGSGRWIVVGTNEIFISTVGLNSWTEATFPAGGGVLYDVAYDGTSIWVAVGNGGSGNIFSSDDNGDNWTKATDAFGTPLYCVAYGGGTWIAVGDSGTLVWSTDGDSWTAGIKSNPANVDDLNSVAYDGISRWVAVGQFGTIWYSDDDGVNWTEIDLETTTFNVVGHDGNGHWLAMGLLGIAWRSTDGVNWIEGNVNIDTMPVITVLGYGP